MGILLEAISQVVVSRLAKRQNKRPDLRRQPSFWLRDQDIIARYLVERHLLVVRGRPEGEGPVVAARKAGQIESQPDFVIGCAGLVV